MAEELMYAAEGFSRLSQDTIMMYNKLLEAHTLVVNFQDRIRTSDWEGKTRQEFEAFLDLTQQFHKALLEEPLLNNKDFLIAMNDKIASFLSDFSEYNNLP